MCWKQRTRTRRLSYRWMLLCEYGLWLWVEAGARSLQGLVERTLMLPLKSCSNWSLSSSLRSTQINDIRSVFSKIWINSLIFTWRGWVSFQVWEQYPALWWWFPLYLHGGNPQSYESIFILRIIHSSDRGPVLGQRQRSSRFAYSKCLRLCPKWSHRAIVLPWIWWSLVRSLVQL